jgi:preprotein translocase subunit SecD
MNRYPMWVNLLVLGVVIVGAFLALPSFFGDDPGVHISRSDGAPLSQTELAEVRSALDEADIEYVSAELEDNAALVRFDGVTEQLRANEVLRAGLPDNVVALTLAPRTPEWLQMLGLRPMALGLDLRGGVHFLYQVDLDSALEQFLENYEGDLRTQLREANIRNQVRIVGDELVVEILDPSNLDRAEENIRGLDDQAVQLTERLIVNRAQIDGRTGFRVQLSETLLRERQDFAVQQNTVTLRNRVNELGVSEPVVQRQGLDRILVQLPGVQDPAQAERVLGATATLEFRLVDTEANAFDAEQRGRAPLGSELHRDRSGAPVVLRREAIVTGDQLTDATSQYSQGQPAVSVRLDAQGGRRMLQTTQANLNRPMAVLLIEEKP